MKYLSEKLSPSSALLKKTRTNIEKYISPILNTVPKRELWTKLGKLKIFEGLSISEKWDAEHVVDILMGLGEGCADSGLLLSIGAHCFAAMTAISIFGTPDQKNKWLPHLASGKKIAAFAATEINAGSDVMSMQTNYKQDTNFFVLNGSKAYITNAPEADLFITFATKDSRLHSRGISAFIIERNTHGFTATADNEKMGLKHASLGSFSLTDVRVPMSQLLGTLNQGEKIFHAALMHERVLLMVGKVGILKSCFEKCSAYTKNRKQFGTAIVGNQLIIDRLINVYRHYITCRLLVLDCIKKLSFQQLTAAEASLTKLHVSEAALESHADLLRIYGALGYLNGAGISEELCNAYGGIIYSGTSEMQKLIIASDLGLID